MKKTTVLLILVSVLLVLSVGINFYLCNREIMPLSWLQSKEFVQDTTLGILTNSEQFREGDNLVFGYDFENDEYSRLLAQYDLAKIAGEGSEFSKAKKLMQEYSGRIKHSSSVAVAAEDMNAEYLLANYLDDKKQGTYCRAKAQILNEMCLALGIYARKLWIIPLSTYDSECHVVNEIWDSEYQKWIMLDLSNNLYWVDENAVPLSMLEVRDKMISGAFCTPVASNDDLSDLEKIRAKNDYYYSYYVKNLAVLKYMNLYTVGESDGYYLLPVNYALKEDVRLISREAVESEPCNEFTINK